jgi:hypothetical protein
MQSCWLPNPDDRPTFDEIRIRLSGLLDVCSQAYGYIQFAQQNQPNGDLPPPSPGIHEGNGVFGNQPLDASSLGKDDFKKEKNNHHYELDIPSGSESESDSEA